MAAVLFGESAREGCTEKRVTEYMIKLQTNFTVKQILRAESSQVFKKCSISVLSNMDNIGHMKLLMIKLCVLSPQVGLAAKDSLLMIILSQLY